MTQYQNLRASKSATPERTHRAGRHYSPTRPSDVGPLKNGQETQLLECNSCRLHVYDAWKGVRCEHIICTDCMVRTTQELVHCQICIPLCVREGNHALCIVCFGCDLLCCCPERLELAPPPCLDTKGMKSIEFYKRVNGAPSAVAEGYCLRQSASNKDGGNVFYKKEVKRERHMVEKDDGDNDFKEKIEKLFARMQKFDQRLQVVEGNYEQIQSKIQDLGNCLPPQALFHSQYGIQPSTACGLQYPGYGQRPQTAPNPDSTFLAQQQQQQQQQLYYGQCQMEYQQQHYQTPGGFPVQGMEQQPCVDSLLPQPQLLEPILQQMSPQPNSYLSVNTEKNPLQPRATVAVIQVRSALNPDNNRYSPANGPYMNLQERADILIENSVKIRENTEGEDILTLEKGNDKDEVKGAEDMYGHAAGELHTEEHSRQRDTNSIWNVQNRTPDAFSKKNAETSAQLGCFVKQLANLYDKVNVLEADNARLRDDQINLQRASTKIRNKVKSIRSAQCRAKTLPSRPVEVEQGQQTTRIHTDGGGMTTTALQVCLEALADQDSSDDSSSTEVSTNGNGQTNGQVKQTPSETRTKVMSDINLYIHNGQNGPVSATHDAVPATAGENVQEPWPAPSAGVTLEHKTRRGRSLPSPPFDNTTITESELETYKKRMDDLTDWYHTCRRRDMFLEQMTWSYLKRQLSSSCHFLDFVSAYYWEVDKCSKLYMGKASVMDFRVFGGPIIDLDCKGLFRFVVDPTLSCISVYLEILISAKPKRGHLYHLKVSGVRSGKAFHEKRYTGEEMFGFKGVLSYPGTPCLGFFSLVVNVDSRILNRDRTLSDTLIIELAKVKDS